MIIIFWLEKNFNRKTYVKLVARLGFLIFLFTFIFSFLDDSYEEMFVVPKVIGPLLIFIIGGIIFEGGYTWWMNTKRYKRLTPKLLLK